MAFGTETIRPVDKIVGPGNRYVTAAKRLVFPGVGIDFIPGPTEVLIIADDTADPSLGAADLRAGLRDPLDAAALVPVLGEETSDVVIGSPDVGGDAQALGLPVGGFDAL